MEALNTLGLRLKEHIGLEELLGENFNPQLYSLTDSQVKKVNALRDVVQEYVRLKDADEPRKYYRRWRFLMINGVSSWLRGRVHNFAKEFRQNHHGDL